MDKNCNPKNQCQECSRQECPGSGLINGRNLHDQMMYLRGMADAAAEHQEPSTAKLIGEMMDTIEFIGAKVEFAQNFLNFVMEHGAEMCDSEDDDDEDDDESFRSDFIDAVECIPEKQLLHVVNAEPEMPEYAICCHECGDLTFFTKEDVDTFMKGLNDGEEFAIECDSCDAFIFSDDINWDPLDVGYCPDCQSLVPLDNKDSDGDICCPICGDPVPGVMPNHGADDEQE